MPSPRQSQALKYLSYSVLYLSLFIIPFLLFGNRFEQFAQVFLVGNSGDAVVALVAGLLLAGDPVLPTPSSVIATLLAVRIGFVPAAIVNGIALSAACILGYAIGRGGGHVLAKSGRGLPPGFVEWVQRYGLAATLLCRPVPVLAEASLILAGAARHEPRSLLAWCCATQLVLGTAYAFAGSGWGDGRWDTAAILFGSVGIPVLAAIVVAVSMYRSRTEPGSQASGRSGAAR